MTSISRLASLLAIPLVVAVSPDAGGVTAPIGSATTSGTRNQSTGVNYGKMLNANSTYYLNVDNSTHNFNVHGKTTEAERLARVQRAVLMNENASALNITGADVTKWLGDESPYISLTLSNPVKMPALAVSMAVLDIKSAGTYQKLKPLPGLRPSTVLREVGNSYSVNASTSVKLPVLGLHDLPRVLPEVYERSPGACLEGVSLELDDSALKSASNPWLAKGLFRQYQSVGILVELRFKDIFGQESRGTRWIFAKYLTGWAPSAAYSRDADGRCVEKAPEADSDRDRHESELQDVAQGGF
ncbi:hypothetical protein RN01_07440 [Cupriavidus sp. SHE]|jgi:hypothetical protein|uniref:Uncharacterized protein n=1 Tax=Cupriavidus metallidurans TaxID=119219 RepID=A0A482IT04_9BURK|nr:MULTISPECIES: hypothetical protein [Cupriavidus]KWR84329.1 hypothetical protein RN01_07440 [Cupriavidus sp. SHE]QBP09920.1 hypothetical protein DDF84_009160 [Cupriavidus metallidurans]